MKSIKFMLIALVAIFVTLGSTSVYAQEDGNRDANGYVVKGPYLTNGGGANWFISVGGGVNTFYNNLEVGNIGIAANANIGKWFTPTIGLRAGYNGLTNEVKTNSKFNGMFYQHYAHGDVLFNVSNALSGYKETRFWDFIPYVQTGLLMVHDKNGANIDREFGVGAGLINELRLSPTVNLNIEIGAVVAHESQFVRPVSDPICVLPSATIGLSFNLGKKKNFDRYSSVAPVAVPFTVDDYNALKQRLSAIESENSDLKDKLIGYQNQKPDTVYVEGQTRVLIGSTVITFPIGSCVLSEVERQKVALFVDSLDDDTLIQIVGSADSKTGSKNRNFALAQLRANVVRNMLIKTYGISPDRISADYTLDATDMPETSRSAILTLSVE